MLRCGSALVRRPAPRQLPVTWSNPQGSVLTPIGDDIWLAERPFYPRLPGLQGTDVGCKAVVVRLPDKTLWVHAPVGLDGPLTEALAALGPVKHIVTLTLTLTQTLTLSLALTLTLPLTLTVDRVHSRYVTIAAEVAVT